MIDRNETKQDMQTLTMEAVTVHPDGPDSGWSGVLSLDGEALMVLERGPDGGVVTRTGSGQDHTEVLGLLEEFVSSTGEPIETTDESLRPETLNDRVTSLVAVGWLIGRIADKLRSCAVAVIDEGLIEAEVPVGGSLEGAVAHMRSVHPDAVVLNDLPIEEAAVEYMRLN